MPHRRAEAEASIIDCSDAVLASCTVEADQIASLYGGEPGRIRIVPPGVDHAFFGPGHRPQARRALGLPLDGRLLLFVGRIQPLKCADVAIETLAELRERERRALPPRRRGRPERPPRGEVAAGPARRGRRPGRARARALHRAPAPRAAVVVLPGGRRLHRAQPLRVLRAGGAGGRRLRDAGRRLGRRRADHAGRPRAHRLPGRRPRPGAPTPPPCARSSTSRWRPSASPPPRCCGPAATPGAPPPARWSSCTTSWPRAASSSAAERTARAATRRRADRRPPRRRGDGRRGRLHRRLGRTGAGGRRASWWRPSARRSPTARRRSAGTSASRATRRTSSRCGSRSSSARCTTRRSSCRRPRTNQAEVFAYLLRRNAHLFGMWFALGPEDAVYLVGRVPGPPDRRRRARPHRRLVGALHRRPLPDGHDPGPPLDLPPPPPPLRPAAAHPAPAAR